MKNKLIKSVLKVGTLFATLFFSSLFFSNNVNAKITIYPNQTFALNYYVATTEKTFEFTTTNRQCFVIPIKIVAGTDITYGGVRIQLYNSSNQMIQNDYISLNRYEVSDKYESHFYSDGFILPAGHYRYKILLEGQCAVSINMSILGYDKLPASASVKKAVNVKSGYWIKIGTLPKDAIPVVKSVNLGKSGILSYWDIEKDGSIYVEGKKIGKTTVTIKLHNGKTYKTTVTVKAGDPNMDAELYDYDTRDNYFLVKVTNNGYNDIIIYRDGRKVVDVDYKAYDRKLKKGKSVTVKPGQTKYIRFYVSGRVTWYEYEDFTLYASFKYQGKKYEWHVWDEDSVYKKGKSWYDTYWD